MSKRSIIQLGPDDFGLYVSHQRGPYGTPLVARGPLDFIVKLHPVTKMSGGWVEDQDGNLLEPEACGLRPAACD